MSCPWPSPGKGGGTDAGAADGGSDAGSLPKNVGLDEYVATSFEVLDGRFTGRAHTLAIGPGKERAVRIWADANGFDLSISAGRHPVVERMMPREKFMPNDVVLPGTARLIILTGPNMAGKSTLLKIAAGEVEADGGKRFLQPGAVGITKAQKATAWFFLVVALLFLIQATVGAAVEHYRVELEGFFGFDLRIADHFGSRRVPVGRINLVDEERTHALLEDGLVDQADHDPIFHPHLVDEVQLVGAFLEQLEADLAGHRRFLADRRRLGRVAGVEYPSPET